MLIVILQRPYAFHIAEKFKYKSYLEFHFYLLYNQVETTTMKQKDYYNIYNKN